MKAQIKPSMYVVCEVYEEVVILTITGRYIYYSGSRFFFC